MKHLIYFLFPIMLTAILLAYIMHWHFSNIPAHPKFYSDYPLGQHEIAIEKPQEPRGDVLICEATAYTHAAEGGDINGTGDGKTTLGWRVDRGIVACDPDVIPMGSIVHVEGYGYAVACDRGGAIRGNRIDVFYNDEDTAMRWGRRKVRVEVVRCGSE